ncbi:TonB-dependent siderophore receptor [Hylemonella gracilis]|uniref:TonB-dependent siderophore receptor n=1 Tax=Hylemonella gracilis TaxID=80880 RepID=A0A4P6UFC2_9BURK|nr:TonB-dependent siderophore receptor [Hylemonella gracilis]QBK03453.1 TonB-dependent siderophore receptor [Hylemonella gracilis]
MKKARVQIKKASTNFCFGFNKRPVAHAVVLALLGVAGTLPVAAQSDASTADASGVKTLEAVTIVSQREARVSTGATGLNLEIKETPQSISVVTTEQMQNFGITNLNDALRLGTGIQVEETETNRTQYTARGFDVKNTQVDGVGMPNDWGIVTGAMDSFGYEKIELIRGANGLLTGVGNAAGTINYVRKRPTNVQQGSMGISYGSWNTKRIEADYSTPFTEDGRWAGRVVAAREEGGSYLRSYEKERTFLYGVIDGQIGDKGTLTLGYSHQQSDSTGNSWGALTFMNSDGTQNDWKRNASTTQDWTYWDTKTQNAFIEYAHQLSTDWQLKLTYNRRMVSNDSKLFYATDYLGNGMDPATGEGLYGYPWRGEDELTEDMGAVTVNGRYDLFGRQHEALFGVSLSKSKGTYDEYAATYANAGDLNNDGYDDGYIEMPGFPWAGNVIPEPIWGSISTYRVNKQRMTRAYGATRVVVTDRLKAMLGANYTEYHREGVSYGADFDQTEGNVSPYAGLTYDFTSRLLGYVSYSDIYQPQDQSDANGRYLEPTKGVNYELGLKADWLDKRLLTTVAVFRAEQDGLATGAGYNANNEYYYKGVDVESTGLEFEAVGKLNSYLDLTFGYTALKLDGEDGDDTYSWVPRRTANLIVSTRLPSYTAVTLGAGGRWQSEISNVESNGYTVRQDSYAVLNAFAAWRVVPSTTVRFNVKNLTDEKYINTLRYSGHYGEPRNYQISLNHQF